MGEDIGKLRREWHENILNLLSWEQTQNMQCPKPLPPPSERNQGESVT